MLAASVTEGVSVLSVIPSVRCEDPAYKRLVPLFYLLAIVFVAGGPLLMLGALIYNHRRGRLSDAKMNMRYGVLCVVESM